MSKKLTNVEFLEKIKNSNPSFLENYKILDTYTDKRACLRVQSKYGIHLIFPHNMLKKVELTIMSAVNKTEYFKKEFNDLQPVLFSQLKIIGEYDKCTNILVQNKYGICKVTRHQLLNGVAPTISLAINKTSYFINMAKEKHNNFYTYEKSIYKCSRTPLIATCPTHKDFLVRPNNHLSGSKCHACWNKLNKFKYENWINNGLNSRHFDSFKCYIIRCWNETEEFYKVGKTFNTLSRRFSTTKLMPYNYEIVQTIINEGLFICHLESSIHLEFMSDSYIPLIKFGGVTECYSINNIHEIINYANSYKMQV